MRPVPRRLVPLILTCLATGGCARMLPPSSYASLVEPAAGLTAEPAATAGIMPGDDGIPPAAGESRVDGGTDPVAALARSQARTARWMADPASRRSLAATLPAAFAPKRVDPALPPATGLGEDRTW